VGTKRTLRVTALRTVATLTAAAAISAGLGPATAYAQPNTADLDREVATAWQQLETVVEKFNTTREGLNSTRAQLADAEAQLAPLSTQVEALRDKVGTIAAGAYMTTSDGPVSALLGAKSAGEMLQQLTMLDHIARGHQHALDALRAASDRYDKQRSDLHALAARQASQDRELSVTKAVVESAIAELQELRAKAYGVRATRTMKSGRDFYVPIFTGDAGGKALRYAYQQMGKEYRWAAAGPDTFDCSGLVLAAWKTNGKTLPHSAALQWNLVRHIQRDELRPGDLVFYFADIHHVAMYAGDGRVIEAPQAGERVSIRQMDFAPIHGYGRVL
jgi:cell wall-associated NlpC family hydrolase